MIDKIKNRFRHRNTYQIVRSIYIKYFVNFLGKIKDKYIGDYNKGSISNNYYNEKAERYLARRANTEPWQKEQSTMKEFLSEIPSGLVVLDAPFGTGRFVDLYLSKNFIIFGIEKSPDMIKAAKRYLNNKFDLCNIKIGDALYLPYKDNMFDLIVSFRFLATIITYDQAKSALKEFNRVTSKYAILQLGEREWSNKRKRSPKRDERMEYWLYPDEVDNLLSDSGFDIIKKSGLIVDSITKNGYRNIHRAFLCKVV